MSRTLQSSLYPRRKALHEYICQRCWRSIQLSDAVAQKRTIHSSRPYPQLQIPHPARDKHLHTGTRTSGVQHHSDVSPSDDDFISAFPIRKAFDGTTRSNHRKPGDLFIRDELREWSLQKQKHDRENATEGLFARNQPVEIPQSLFVEEESTKHDADYDEELLEYDESYQNELNKIRLVPGDLLMIDMPMIRPQFGVFIGQVDSSYQVLLRNRRWAMGHLVRPTTLILHDYATPEEIAAIKQHLPKSAANRPNALGMAEQYTTTGEVPFEIAAPVVERISTLMDQNAAFRARHMASLDRIYDICAHEDRYEAYEFKDLVKKVFRADLGELDDGALTAIFSALHTEPSRILSVNALPQELRVHFTPKALVHQFDKVTNWAREYQECAAQASLGEDVGNALTNNPLNAFIDKARRLIVKSRRTRSPTTIGVLGPTLTRTIHEGPIELKETGEDFSAEDKMILEFLWSTYQRLPMPRRKHRHHSLGSLILRAIGAYPNLKLERKIGRLLLQEVGALAPWSEKSDENILIPIPGRRGAHIADQLFATSESTAQDLGFDAIPNEVPMTDSLAHLRKDWGETEVLCIDKPTAFVLDDGVSVEEVEGSPGAYWVHVHIAHPTAHFSPDHVFAQRGRHFGVSIYTSRTSYQMLPDSVGRTFSLGPNKPVLTVSSLVLPSGEVQDVKMSAGIIRRVVRLTPSAVDAVLGRSQSEQAIMIVGQDVKTPRATADEKEVEAAKRHLKTLKTIEGLMRARIEQRKKEVRDIPTFETQAYDIAAWTSFLEPYDPNRLTKSYHYVGDPSIKVVADRYSLSAGMVERLTNEPITAHAMILASESAGRWLVERHIPAVFNGVIPNPEWPISRLNKATRNEQTLAPFAKMSSAPLPHVNLMISQYARVTSPLRRFSDMMTMWQIDSILLHQGARGLQSGDVGGPDRLPYTKEMIDEYLDQRQSTLLEIDKLMKKSILHWTFQALFRAFHFKEAPLPEVWDMKVEQYMQLNDPDYSQLRGSLYPFKIICDLMKSKEGWENQCQMRDYIPVKIELVDVARSKVYCRAVGPPSSEPTQTGPFHVASPPNAVPTARAPVGEAAVSESGIASSTKG